MGLEYSQSLDGHYNASIRKRFLASFHCCGINYVGGSRTFSTRTCAIHQRTNLIQAKGMGFSSARIFIHHIFPLLIPSLIVIGTANFASAILIESGLSFLGIGAQPPIPSWGGMIKDHFRYITRESLSCHYSWTGNYESCLSLYDVRECPKGCVDIKN